MSTPTYERNIDNSEKTKIFNCVDKAKDLAIHTIKICSNEHIFKEEYQRAIVDDLIETAKNIYCNVDEANNVFVNEDAENYIERRTLQERAAMNCNRLLSLIGISKELFHLRNSKVDYWISLTVETRKLIRNWKESDRKRYGNLK